MIYALACGIPEQMAVIDARCFGECGKIVFGAVELGEYGAFMVCRQADCPHVEKQGLLDGAEVDGEGVTLRKLREPAAPAPPADPEGGG